MNLFNWKDVLIIFVAFLGAVVSSKKIPDLNTDSRLVNFAKEIMTTVSITIFCTLANTNIEVTENVKFLMDWLGFPIPFYAYVLVVALGVMFLLNSALQTLLIKSKDNANHLYFVVPVIALIDLSILTHLLIIS